MGLKLPFLAHFKVTPHCWSKEHPRSNRHAVSVLGEAGTNERTCRKSQKAIMQIRPLVHLPGILASSEHGLLVAFPAESKLVSHLMTKFQRRLNAQSRNTDSTGVALDQETL